MKDSPPALAHSATRPRMLVIEEKEAMRPRPHTPASGCTAQLGCGWTTGLWKLPVQRIMALSGREPERRPPTSFLTET